MIRKVLKPAKRGSIPLSVIRKAVRSVSMNRESKGLIKLHVMRSICGKWAVRRRGGKRASKLFERNGRARQYAKHLLGSKHGAIYFHMDDGRVAGKFEQ